MALVLAAVLLLPYSAKSAGANDPNVADEPPAVSEPATPAPDGLASQGAPEASGQITEETPVATDAQADGETPPGEMQAGPAAEPAPSPSNGPLDLPNANPAYTLELTSDSFNVTYPNHQTATHDKKYIPLIVNGTLIDSEVILVKDRTLAPLRVLTEALGGSVDWDDATHTVTIHKGDDVMAMTIGSTTVTINGAETTIDVPPDIYNDLTYLPLRFVAETLGARVSYNTGEYDPSTMTYKSYMLVQGVSANAVIDQYDPSWPVDSEFQAQAAVMSLSRSLFGQFSQQNSAAHPDTDFTPKYNFIQYNIDNTRVVGSVSRYYVVESFCLFLYDKYTGTIYTIGSNSTSNWVKRYAEGDPQNMSLFADTYFFSSN
jgi:hypothetical protein